MKGVISRTEFYLRHRHDPEIIRRLDIRQHPTKARGLHCDRQAVLDWIDELVQSHEPALESSPNANNLGKHSKPDRRRSNDDSFGVQLAALCAALEEGAITRVEFERAKADLEAD